MQQEHCPDHSETMKLLGAIEERTKPLPNMAQDLQDIKMQNARSIGFIAGVSAVVSLVVTIAGPFVLRLFSVTQHTGK